MQDILKDVENASKTMKNMFHDLVKNSAAKIFEKIKPIKTRYNTTYTLMEDRMNNLTDLHEKKIKKHQEESASKIQDMGEKINKEIKSDQSNNKIQELDQKIDAMQKPKGPENTSETNIMEDVANQLQEIWDNNYGMSLKERLNKIESNYTIHSKELNESLHSYNTEAELLKGNLTDMQTSLSKLSTEIKENEQIFEKQKTHTNACINSFIENTGYLKRLVNKYRSSTHEFNNFLNKEFNENKMTKMYFNEI